MTINVKALFAPNKEVMRRHLEHLFGGYLDGYHNGMVELAWTEPLPDINGKHPLKHARLFGTDQLDELVEEAARLNAQTMCNVYIGAALRKPGTAPFGRSQDSDAYVLTAAYVDLDDPGAATAAKDIYGKAKPTLVVVTGQAPHTRAQMWWRLDEPLTDPSEWPALLKGMAAAMKGDSTVTNPARVMRLAGSIAWPVKEGRRVELTDIAPLREPGQSVYAYGHMAHLFPPIATMATAPAPNVTHATNSLGLATKISDGREGYMTRTIAACLVEYIGTTGAAPSAEELFEAAWPQYERNVDFSRAGRGADEFAEKCAYTVNRFQRGEIRGVEDLDKAIEVYRNKAQAKATANIAAQPQPETAHDDDGPFQASTLAGTPPEREWLVPEWIPAGAVGSIYGDGGVGKTLIAQQLLYAASIGGKWLGLEVPKCRALGVFCEDDKDELHRRHDSIKQALGFGIGNPFEDAFLWPRVGFDNLLVTFDRESKPTMSTLFERTMKVVLENRIGLLVLDTAADLFGGNEVVRGQVNYFIKAVCGAYIRRAKELGFVLTVVILAHPSQAGRNSGTGESGSTGWSNAVRSRLYLTKPDDGLPEQRILTRKKSNYSAAGDDVKLELMWFKGAIVRQADAEKSDDGTAVKSAVNQILRKVHDAFERGQPYGNNPSYDSFIGKRIPAEMPHLDRRIIGAALDHIRRNQMTESAKTPSGNRRGFRVSDDAKVELGL
jgi:RecA-family ATPase